jgi:tetratricopeptide (TPR) repeat protein
MKITLSVVSLSFAGVLSGCSPVVSVQPLYTQAEIQKPYLNQRVEGEWIMADLDNSPEDAATPQPPCRVSISKSSAGEVPYAVEFRCPGSEGDPGEEYSKYDFSLVSLGTATFFDARFAESKEKEKHISLGEITDKGIIPAHLLGQVWVQQDFVRFAPLQSDWVEKNWPANFLVISKVEKYDKVAVLTNPTPDLRDLFSRNAGSPDAFSAPLFLCRAGADCDARAMEDQLTRTPNSLDVLAGAVKFYAKRGNLASAISLQRHKIELDSDAAADQFTLGRLLLLTRDFDGARGALAAAKEPSERPSIKELVVRSHFLQGNYAGTVQAAKSLDAPANLSSADPIILSYFALNRLGRVKEAESYLREQASTFVGPAQEQLFLLGILGRVTDSLSSSKDQGRSTYYYVLNRLRNGDLEHGRGHLQDLAKMRPKDDLIGLAARIELERLPSTTNK